MLSFDIAVSLHSPVIVIDRISNVILSNISRYCSELKRPYTVKTDGKKRLIRPSSGRLPPLPDFKR